MITGLLLPVSWSARSANSTALTPFRTLPSGDVARSQARLFAALIETYQRADSSVAIPEKLQPYFGAAEIK